MTKYSSAEQILRPGEVGLFIFTDGTNLTINPDGTGETGNWVVDLRRRVVCVIIYKRDTANPSHNDLFIAQSGDFDGPRDDRYLINLRDIKHLGNTDVNWSEFASTGAMPIRYIARQ